MLRTIRVFQSVHSLPCRPIERYHCTIHHDHSMTRHDHSMTCQFTTVRLYMDMLLKLLMSCHLIMQQRFRTTQLGHIEMKSIIGYGTRLLKENIHTLREYRQEPDILSGIRLAYHCDEKRR